MDQRWWSNFWENAPGLAAIIFLFGGAMITGIIALIVNGLNSNRENERIAVLKQQMLDKGMSADDIVRVIEAGPKEVSEAEE